MKRGSVPVTYSDGKTEVRLGDRVQVRFFFRRRVGEVHYVPGISAKVEEYEHDSLTWVGLSLPDGWATAVLVDPESQRLQAKIRFLGRGEESAAARRKLATVVANSEAEVAVEEGEENQESEEPPTAIDWVALAVAMLIPAVLLTAAVVAIVWGLRFLLGLL